ncbi:serine hydrolase [Fulvivirga maritima]|uniref:serine hydrolase n=1 Tax=Fulvivirga maritima TaxID=2904247 RepID=UPI00351F5AF4
MAIGQCQTLISGSVINNQTKQPIPYVNIGIANTEVGTISNEDGSFTINIPLKYSDQDLLFSSVGYIRKSFPISSISTAANNLVVSLNENVLELGEVEIVAKQEKKKSVTLGNGKSLLLSGQIHYDTLSAGSAMALLIDKSDNKNLTFLKEASLHIAKNLSPEFKVRMRIMSVDSQTDKPGVDLLTHQVLVTSDVKKGWLDFEISDTQIVKEDQFFLVFEWIMDKDDRKYVTSKYEQYMKMYPARVSYDTVIINHEKVVIPQVSTVVAGTVFGVTKSKKDREHFKCYYRSNSFGEWKTSSGILSAKVTLSNYPPTDEPETNKLPCDALACKIDQWATDFQNEFNPTGFQLSIGKSDTIIFSQGYGYADKVANILVDRQTQFRIASVSKTMTSAAIMQLYAKGLLYLDTAIQTYVPAFPKKEIPYYRKASGQPLKWYPALLWEKLGRDLYPAAL